MLTQHRENSPAMRSQLCLSLLIVLLFHVCACSVIREQMLNRKISQVKSGMKESEAIAIMGKADKIEKVPADEQLEIYPQHNLHYKITKYKSLIICIDERSDMVCGKGTSETVYSKVEVVQ